MNEFTILLDRLLETKERLAVAEKEIDSLRSSGPIPSSSDVIEMMSGMATGRKIEAIKFCRSLTGYGLKEAKDMVEAVMNPQNQPT